jgi:hypothetical protein
LNLSGATTMRGRASGAIERNIQAHVTAVEHGKRSGLR